MNSERLPDLPTELESFAEQLGSLAPAIGGLRRDELMYRAGWEAGVASVEAVCCDSASTQSALHRPWRYGQWRKVTWMWALSTAALLLVSATLAVILASQAPEVRVVYVQKPPHVSLNQHQREQSPTFAKGDDMAATSATAPSVPQHNLQVRTGDDFFSLRNRVLAFGVDVLGANSSAPSRGNKVEANDSRYGVLLHQLRGG